MRLCARRDLFLLLMIFIATKCTSGYRTSPHGIDLNKPPPRSPSPDLNTTAETSEVTLETTRINPIGRIDDKKRKEKSQKNLVSSRERMQKAKTGNQLEIMTLKRKNYQKRTMTKFEYVNHHREMRRRQLADRMRVESVRLAYNEKKRLQYHRHRDRISARRKIKRNEREQSGEHTIVQGASESEPSAPPGIKKRGLLMGNKNVLFRRALVRRPNIDLNEPPPLSPTENTLMPKTRSDDKKAERRARQDYRRENCRQSTRARMQRARQSAPSEPVLLFSGRELKASSMTNEDYLQRRRDQFARSRARRILKPGFRESEKWRRKTYYDRNHDAVLERARQRYHENRDRISQMRKDKRQALKECGQGNSVTEKAASSTAPMMNFFDRSRAAAAVYRRRQRISEDDVMRANAHALNQATSSQFAVRAQRLPQP